MRLDGKTFRTRIRGKATIHDDAETLAQHHGAKVVVRHLRDLPELPALRSGPMGASVDAPGNPYVPRPGYEPPAPEWKSRDYLKDVLSKYDPHRKGEE